MITMQELLGKHSLKDCDDKQIVQLTLLLAKLNEVRKEWAKPMVITSGLRNHDDMKRIYKSDNYPKMSKHLFGQAADISDPNGDLYNWFLANNSAMLKKFGLWMELGTKGWVHVQIVPMGSYNPKTDIRVFKP